LLLCALLLCAACSGGTSDPAATTSTPPALHGAMPTGPSVRPAFTLTTTQGGSYDFSRETSGRITLLYAGYTHCPDECPTSMADIAQALRDVPPAVAQKVVVVFVTTDPWRDSARVLRTWLDHFHSPVPYIGLTGTPVEVVAAEAAMGIPLSTKETAPKGSKVGGYSVSHFAAVLVYGSDDRLQTLYPSGVTPADMATDLEVLVKG